MQDQVKAVVAILSLVIIIIWTGKGCYYCLQGLVGDRAGLWITVGECLAALAWVLLGIDILIYNTMSFDVFVIGIIFWTAMASKVSSVIIKTELGYRGIRDTYRNRGLW